MIRALILYYLSLKPTHGYEIQKFIQLNHMDSWTKIQSGSIYYALSKLEKEGLIVLYQEESIGAKVRKIYKITDEGRAALKVAIEEELDRQIYETGADKFIVYPILEGMDKETIIRQVAKHIEKLRVKRDDIEKWQKIKIGEESLKVESICFEMMLSSIDYQIKWHEALTSEIDQCKLYSKQMSELIKQVDFSTVNDMSEIMQNLESNDVEKLKQEILNNPETAAQKLEELIKLIKH